MWMGTKLSLLQKSGQGKRLGWQQQETTTTEITASARNSDVPNKALQDSDLPETPKLTEAQSRDTN